MLVKCWDLNEKRDRDICWKSPTGKYYSSEDAYNKIVEENMWWQKFIELIQDILHHDKNQKIPSYFLRRIKDNFKYYPNEVLYKTLEKDKEFLEKKLWDATFNGERHQINYMFRVIENDINDVYAGCKRDRKIKAVSGNAVNDIEEDTLDKKEVETRKDVSSLLGGDTWI